MNQFITKWVFPISFGSAVIAIVLFGVNVQRANASSLTTSQINAVVSLLQSFNVDSATIANVQASLTGTSSQTPAPQNVILSAGGKGAEVSDLQNTLKANGY